jgi:hypothetical protein
MARSGLASTLVGCACVLVGGPVWAASQTLTPSDDTFINAGNPTNNNGASASVFTGTDGHGGIMRGLVQFVMPPGLQGRVVVTGAELTMTVQALGDGSAGTAAIESLRALTEPWVQGNGLGDAPSSFTVGQPCGGSIAGATWTEPNCPTSAPWTTAGGTVASAVSGQADTTGLSIGTRVSWASSSNPAMTADVQGWIDNPGSNHGWRISSSTEGATAQAQRFFSNEAGTTGPRLQISYSCKAGFVASGNDCIASAPASVPGLGPRGVASLALLLFGVAIARQKQRQYGSRITSRRPRAGSQT